MELNNLPDSILLEILQYVSYDTLCLGVRLANRKLYNLSYDSSLWKFIEVPHHFTDQRFLMWMKRVHMHLEGIDCSQCDNLTVKAFEGLGEYEFPKLKHLAVPISCSFPDHIYMNLVQVCPELEELENVVANEEGTCHPIICQSLFKNITIVHDKPVSTYGRLRRIILRPSVVEDNNVKRTLWKSNLETLSERCPKINKFHCRRGLDYINDESITDVARMFPQLEELELHYCTVGDDGLINFFALHSGKLLQLALDKADDVTDKGIEEICGKLKHLKKLKIARCPHITNIGVQNLIGNCHNLRDVHLNNNMKMVDYTDATVIHIAKNCPLLNSLSIFNSASLTDKSVSALKHHCKSLTGLLLYQCPNISDESLASLRNITFLKSLVLIHCEKLTPNGVIDLILKSSHLHRLTLFNKTRQFFGDQTGLGEKVISILEELGSDYLPNVLKGLNLQGVGGAFVQLVTVLCSNLQTLDLRDDIPLTVKTVNILLENCTNLKVLDATHLPELDDTFVEALCTNGQRLTKVALGDAVQNIAPDGLCRIISECISLKTFCLDLKIFKIDEKPLIDTARATHGGHVFLQEDTSSQVLLADDESVDHGRYIEIFMTPIKYLQSVPGNSNL